MFTAETEGAFGRELWRGMEALESIGIFKQLVLLFLVSPVTDDAFLARACVINRFPENSRMILGE